MRNICVRMTDHMVQGLDDKIVNSQYASRSDLIRDLCRRYLDGTIHIPQVARR